MRDPKKYRLSPDKQSLLQVQDMNAHFTVDNTRQPAPRTGAHHQGAGNAGPALSAVASAGGSQAMVSKVNHVLSPTGQQPSIAGSSKALTIQLSQISSSITYNKKKPQPGRSGPIH